jgi:hypothetical protein
VLFLLSEKRNSPRKLLDTGFFKLNHDPLLGCEINSFVGCHQNFLRKKTNGNG